MGQDQRRYRREFPSSCAILRSRRAVRCPHRPRPSSFPAFSSLARLLLFLRRKWIGGNAMDNELHKAVHVARLLLFLRSKWIGGNAMDNELHKAVHVALKFADQRRAHPVMRELEQNRSVAVH